MNIVKQVIVETGTEILKCRYNPRTGLLYQQNRSKDVEICLDDYLDRMNKTRETAKSRGYNFRTYDVAEKADWNA